MITQALLVRLEARHRREDELERYLLSLLPLVKQELRTSAWFALRLSRKDYAVFAAFAGVEARESHLAGAAVSSLHGQADFLLARQPHFQRCAVLADKLSLAALTDLLTKALLLSFKAKAGHAAEVEQFLRDAKAAVIQEARTCAWFALMLDDGSYGSFSVFPDQGARLLHLTGRVPRAMAKHAFSLLGSMPELDMMGVLATALPQLQQA
jgi:quinol monooxygenase YgiN